MTDKDSVCLEYDKKQLKYDLAMTYAKSKLEYAISHKLIDYDGLPPFVAECDYLYDTFCLGLRHFEWLNKENND